MKHRSPFSILWPAIIPVAASFGLLACSGEDNDPAPDDITVAPGDTTADDTTPDQTTATEDSSEPVTPSSCERGTLEPDLAAAPLAGVSVDDGRLRAGDYIVSATYLQLKPDARQTVDQLLQPIFDDLQTRDGLLALSLGQSESCVALRTLAVWRDDAAMIAFVTSPAHLNAMTRVTDVSRGGSVVTHWVGDAASVSWPAAAEHLGATDGPVY